VTIEGTVTQKNEKQTQFGQNYTQYRVDKYLVEDYGDKCKLQIGMKASVLGRFKSIDKMKYNDFDYGLYLRSTGVKGVVYVDSVIIIGKNKFIAILGDIKTEIKNINRYLYKEKSNFVNSITISDKSDMTGVEKDMFSRTGTSHVISISGLHTGILCMAIAFVIRGINKFYKLVVLSLVISTYAVLIGMPVSVIRAVFFTFTMYLATFVDRKRDGISTLSIIGALVLIQNPYTVYNVSFQLSFLVTLSIIYFEWYLHKIIKFRVVSLTISANILTLPIIYYSFGGIPVLAVLGNAVIVPLISAILGLSLVSGAVYGLSLTLAKFAAFLNTGIINVVYWFLYEISEIPYSYIEIREPKLWIVVIYYIIAIASMVYLEIREMRENKNELQGYCKRYTRGQTI
jgi:competence protein ComEC